MITLIHENPINIEFDIGEALETLDIASEDITDMVFVIKDKQRDSDNSALVYKTLANSGITLSANKFYVTMVQADYADLKTNTTYHIALGIKYTGIANFLELDLQGEDRVRIVQDTIRS